MEFNRQQLIENISHLIQQQKLKVGDVEQAIGTSAGYLSRLSKAGNESIPAADIVWKLARYFNVSTDSLISGDFSSGTDNLSVLKRFIAKLSVQTNEGILDWKPITTRYVNAVLKGNEPLFFLVRNYGYIRGIPEMDEFFSEARTTYAWYNDKHIVSAACPQDCAWMEGDGFCTTLTNGKKLYIFHMCAEIDTATPAGYTEIPYYEMYLLEKLQDNSIAGSLGRISASLNGSEVENWKPTQIFDTLGAGSELEDPIQDLYSIARQNAYDLKIDAEVKSTILSFLDDDIVTNGIADASTFPSENQK